MWARLRTIAERFTATERGLATLLRGAALVMVLQVAGVGVAYGMQVVVARWAGAFEYGVFAYAWTWMNLIYLVGSFGMGDAALRLIPSYSAHGEWAKVRGMVIRGPAVVFAPAAVLGLVGAGLILLLGDRVGEYYRVPLVVTFIAMPLIGVLAYFHNVGRALGSVLTAFLPRYFGLPGAVLAGVAVYVWIGEAPTATGLIYATAVGIGVLALVQGVALIRVMPHEAKTTASETPVRAWVKLAMPLMFITVCYALLTHCDMLMVGFFLSANEVAIYQAASRTAALISFPLFALNALVAPMIARHFAEKRMDELQRSVSIATRVAFWPSLVGALLAVAGGKYLLGVFGQTFEQGHLALAILILGHIFNVGCGPVSYLMTMTGNQDRCAVVWAVTIAGQFVLNLALIPAFGILGAAIATTAATCFLTISLTILVSRRLNISAHALAPTRPALARANQA